MHRPSFCILHSAFCIAVALATASARARTVSITDTHYADGVASSFDLAIGAGENAEGLYMAYGNLDGGDDIDAWENVSKVADIPAATTSYTASAPAGWGTSVSALRFFMATVADLPYDVQFEYVYTIGKGECADTGYRPTSNTKVAIDMSMQGNNGNTYIPIWGYRRSSGVDAFALFINKNYRQFALNFTNTDVKAAADLTVGERFIYRNDNSKQYLTRVERGESETCILDTTPHLDFEAPEGWTIALGGMRTSVGGNIDVRGLQMRVYSFKIWEGDTLMRDYVPAMNNGTVGLYDRQSRTMLTSSRNRAGDVSFANGPVVLVNGGFASSTAAPATVFALGAPITGAAVREVAISATNRISGAISSLGLSFSPSPSTNYLYLAYGATDGGDDPSDWDHLDFVGIVKPFESSATVAAPAGWGDSVLALRFFLGVPPAKPYDRDLEYIASTGSQWIDTGVHFRYGQKFSLKWRQYSIENLFDCDAGWGVGVNVNGVSRNFIGGGYSSAHTRINLWIKGSAYNFTPVFNVADLTTSVIYLDECTALDPVTYTMTDIASGDVWTLGTAVTPQDGENYESNSNLFLGRYGTDNKSTYAHLGKKAFYQATLETAATGEKVFDLVPVEKDGEACMYDTVSGNIHHNAGSGTFFAGPEVPPRIPSSSFASSSAALSLVGKPRVVAGDTGHTTYTTATVGYDVVTLGNAAAVDVELLYGPSADALTLSATIATSVGQGTGTGTLPGLTPGRVYYARLVASDGAGNESEPSPLFTISIPLPDSPAGGNLRPITSAEAVGGMASATFPAYSVTTPLYLAYGAEYGGETTNGWEHVVKVADIPGASTNASCALPQGWGSSVKFLRFFFSGEVPEGVTILDSLTTTGAQYVNTGLYPTNDFKAEIIAKSGGTGSDFAPLMGERRTSSAEKFNFVLWLPRGTTYVNVRPNCGNQQYDIGNQNAGKPTGETCTYSLSLAEGLLVDGTQITPPSSFVPTDIAARDPLILFGLNSDGSIDSRKFPGTFYAFRAYFGQRMAMNLLPCESNGTVALYDSVSGTVFQNLGTGAGFTGGTPVEAGFASFSDVVVAPDASAPILGEVAASGAWRGDRVTVSGTLASAGAGSCAIAVETSRSGDFTDAVTWPCAGTYAAEDAFSVELHSADATSDAYIRPGQSLWYRAKVTDAAGQTDYSLPAEVTTRAALAIRIPTIATSAGRFTVTAQIDALGANTNYLWVLHKVGETGQEYATAKVALGPDYASNTVDVPGISAATGPGTLFWSLVISNDCSTAVWTSQTEYKGTLLANALRYTWRKGAAEGNWEDSANWDASEGRFAYPTSESEAYFAGGTTAKVSVVSALAEVNKMYCSENDVVLVFTGGKDHKLKTGTFDTNAAGGSICFSNIAFEVTNNGMEINQGRTMIFHDALGEIYNAGEFGARGGPDRHFIVSGGSYVKSSGNLVVGGEGSTVVIDDSYVDLYATSHGFFFSSNADGGDIILKGRNARLEAVSMARCAGRRTSGGRLIFVVPEGGYAATPVVQVTDRHTAATYDTSRMFGNDTPANASIIRNTTILIAPDSPGLSASRTIRQPLISWKNGLAFEKLVFETPSVRPRSNFFAYAAEFDETDGPYGWETTWTDGEAPLSLGFIHEQATTVIMVR